MVRGMFGLQRNVRDRLQKIRNEELRNLYYSPNIVGILECKIMECKTMKQNGRRRSTINSRNCFKHLFNQTAEHHSCLKWPLLRKNKRTFNAK